MNLTRALVDENKDRFLEELIHFLRIPSISADSQYKGDVERAADWLISQFGKLGMDKIEKFPTKGHPIIFAEKMVDPSLPTILTYGHYDVQPPDPLDLWHSPPFEPVIKDEKIYARGPATTRGKCTCTLKRWKFFWPKETCLAM